MFSSLFLCSDDPISILSFRRHCDVALFSLYSYFCRDLILFMPIHLTGVLCHFFSRSFIFQVIHLLSTEMLPESVLSYSSFFTKCFQLCSSLLLSFFHLFNLSRFFGFTHWSKKQLCFTSSLSLPFFSLRCHSRSRDEILS